MTDDKQTKINEALDKSQQEATDFPPTWDYKENKIVMGKVASMHTAQVDGETREVMILEQGDGEKVTVWINTVLQSFIKRLGVVESDMVAVRFEGTKSNKTGSRTYNNFTMAVIEKGKE